MWGLLRLPNYLCVWACTNGDKRSGDHEFIYCRSTLQDTINVLFSIGSDFFLTYRHPMTTQRLNFPDISRQLSLPDTKLLKWSEEDKSGLRPEAATLGADLLCGEELYKDLQTRYKNQNQTGN